MCMCNVVLLCVLKVGVVHVARIVVDVVWLLGLLLLSVCVDVVVDCACVC